LKVSERHGKKVKKLERGIVATSYTHLTNLEKALKLRKTSLPMALKYDKRYGKRERKEERKKGREKERKRERKEERKKGREKESKGSR